MNSQIFEKQNLIHCKFISKNPSLKSYFIQCCTAYSAIQRQFLKTMFLIGSCFYELNFSFLWFTVRQACPKKLHHIFRIASLEAFAKPTSFNCQFNCISASESSFSKSATDLGESSLEGMQSVMNIEHWSQSKFFLVNCNKCKC